ncbi:hypothetical protein DFJ74DRAFT_677821 [Hyaloraphidium curvatum]|nr:hypothetical protein DFJ74DRAFT_677821 [Hyaloraphidium curvatum]
MPPSTDSALPKSLNFFLANEWLALFPAEAAPPRDSPPWLANLASLDPATELRTARSLTAPALLEGLREEPGLRRLVAAQLWLARYVSVMAVTRLLFDTSQAFIFLVVWAFNDGRFGTRQMIAATGALVMEVMLSTSGIFFFGMAAAVEANAATLASSKDLDHPATLDSHPLAGYVRWRQLCKDRVGGTEPSPLVEHVDGDPMCPCPRASCAGPLARGAFSYFAILLAAIWVSTNFSWVLVMAWTSLVTFGPVLWRTPWSATLCALALFQLACNILATFTSLVVGAQLNPKLLELERRLRRRAARLCLYALLADIAGAKEGNARPVEDWPYAALHAKLVSSWTSRTGNIDGQLKFWGYLICTLTCTLGAINVLFGSCLTGNFISSIIVVIGLLLVFLGTYAAANSEPAGVARQYRSARDSLLALVVAEPADRAASAHARMLDTFTELQGSRAAFLRFDITFSTIRGLVITLVTVVVGLWSVMRSAGVFVTLESVCPWPTG